FFSRIYAINGWEQFKTFYDTEIKPKTTNSLSDVRDYLSTIQGTYNSDLEVYEKEKLDFEKQKGEFEQYVRKNGQK
ncbi:MAG TPA: hypothetical protein VEP90_00745, partial [Methylomirabilota bacterium]|nr:hypothetical protein [Methylomirabilota bacterium]